MRRALIAAAAAVAVVSIAGCTPEVPAPSTAASVEAGAALQDDQAQVVIDETFDELAAADAKLDASLLDNRVAGQVKSVRATEYKLKKADKSVALSDIPDEMQAIYLPAEGGWPRVMAAVTVEPDDDLTPVVLVWVQEDIEDDYTLVGWAHMVPGATLPSMPGPSTGASVLALDTDTIDPTPESAYEDYLELLRAGSGSDLNDQFAPDTYRDSLFSARKSFKTSVKDSDGKAVDTIEPSMDDTFAIGTADGGALVFAPLKVSSALSVKDATIKISKENKPLVKGKIGEKATFTYADFLVMYVPGPGADALPGVVAADRTLTRISAS